MAAVLARIMHPTSGTPTIGQYLGDCAGCGSELSAGYRHTTAKCLHQKLTKFIPETHI